MVQSKPESNKKGSGRGGKRPGSGRKSKEVTKLRDDFNAATNQTLIEWLPDLLRNLKRLADGGYERVEETFEEDESVVLALRKRSPDDKPTPQRERKLVCVKRVRSIAEPDRAANEFLVNRLLGKPTQAVELAGKGGKAIEHAVTIFLPDNGRNSID